MVMRTHTGRPFAFKEILNTYMMELGKGMEKSRNKYREEIRAHAAMMRRCKTSKNKEVSNE